MYLCFMFCKSYPFYFISKILTILAVVRLSKVTIENYSLKQCKLFTGCLSNMYKEVYRIVTEKLCPKLVF